MKKAILIIISTVIYTIFATNAFADYVTLSWNQYRSDTNLKGWRIYYAVHVDGEVPDPAVSKTEYDVMIDMLAFDTPGNPAQTPLSQIDLPSGMKVYPWPDNPEDWWNTTCCFYLPPYALEENKQYYMAVSVYDLAENESDLGNIINFSINPPGQPGEAVPDGGEPF